MIALIVESIVILRDNEHWQLGGGKRQQSQCCKQCCGYFFEMIHFFSFHLLMLNNTLPCHDLSGSTPIAVNAVGSISIIFAPEIFCELNDG